MWAGLFWCLEGVGATRLAVLFPDEVGMHRTATVEKLASLKQNAWINSGTQWARIETVVYNPNLGTFGVLQFKVDYDNSGYIKSKMNIEVINAANYGNAVSTMLRLCPATNGKSKALLTCLRVK